MTTKAKAPSNAEQTAMLVEGYNLLLASQDRPDWHYDGPICAELNARESQQLRYWALAAKLGFSPSALDAAIAQVYP